MPESRAKGPPALRDELLQLLDRLRSELVTAREAEIPSKVREVTEAVHGLAAAAGIAERPIDQLYRILAGASPDRIIANRSDGSFIWVVPARGFEEQARQDLGGKTIADVLPPEVAGKIMANIGEALSSGTVRTFEYEVPGEEGVSYFEARLAPVGDEEVISFVRDVTDRKLGEKALHESEKTFRDFFTRLPVAAYESTPEGSLLAGNPALENLLGYSVGELQGDWDQGVVRLYRDPEDRERCTRILRQKGALSGEEYVLIRRDGREIVVREFSFVVRDARGRIVGYRGTLEDVTGQRRLEEELKGRNAELEGILSIIGHDLGTPLTVIIGYADVLDETLRSLDRSPERCGGAAAPAGSGDLQRTMKKAVRAIFKHGTRLHRFVDGIVEFSRARNREYEARPLDVTGVLEGVLRDRLEDWTLQADGLAAEIKVVWVSETGEALVDGSGPTIFIGTPLPQVMAHREAVGSIFANLLGNAIKYGGQPQIVEVGGLASSSGEATFWVKDNGIGISEDFREKLFKPFERDRRVRDREGIGLGLATVKTFVEKFGGVMWAEDNAVSSVDSITESTKRRGTTFLFTLPGHRGDCREPG